MVKTKRTKNADFVKNAKVIVDAANKIGVPIRILGAIATRLHCTKEFTKSILIKREVSDIDLISYSRFGKEINRLFLNLNHTPYERFNALYGDKRSIFYDEDKKVIDIFFNKLPMCHTIDFTGRLELDYPTITLADLMLTKLQIIEFEEKDFRDVVCILKEHEVGTIEDESINANRIAEVLAIDWGFYYTATSNLGKIKDALNTSDMTRDDQEIVKDRIKNILRHVEAAPKNIAWRLRAKIGTKKKWYTDIEYRKESYN